MKKKYLFYYMLFLLVSLMYFPPLCFFLSILFLLLEGYSGSTCRQTLVYLNTFTFLAMLVNTLSITTLVSAGDDFVAYYNNYLYFLNGYFDVGFSQFKYEIGVPIINYLLSIIIESPLPYIVKLCHLIIMFFLLQILIKKIKKKYKLQIKDIFILTALIMLFFKCQYTFLMLRQGYASIFICFALFSINKKVKFYYLCIAMLFHFSSIIVYYLCYFILFNRNNKKQKVFVITCVVAGVLFLFLGEKLQIITQWNSLLHKLTFAFNKLLETSNIINAIKTNVVGGIYILPLLVISIYKKSYPPIIAITFFVVSTCYIPGFSYRVIMPIYSILVGYIYFDAFFIENKIKGTIIIFMLFNLFMFLNVISSSLYYQRYAFVNEHPFYYLNTFFDVNDNYINRMDL